MCYKCCNYLNEPKKCKTQWEMGKQFRCTKPSAIADCDEESANNSISQYTSESEAILGDELSTDKDHIVLSPPRKFIIVEYKGNSNYCMNGMSDNNVRVTKVDGIMY
jgi:hypothetical protein